MSPDRLIYMANQIGKFFESQGHDKAVPGIAEHIRKFWDPRMRTKILAHLDAGGAGLDPDVRDALATLRVQLPTSSRALTSLPRHPVRGPPAMAFQTRRLDICGPMELERRVRAGSDRFLPFGSV